MVSVGHGGLPGQFLATRTQLRDVWDSEGWTTGKRGPGLSTSAPVGPDILKLGFTIGRARLGRLRLHILSSLSFFHVILATNVGERERKK